MQKKYLFFCILLIFSCQESPKENIYMPPLEKESFDNKLYINLEVNDFLSKISKINLLDNKISSFDENKKQVTFEINPENIQDFIDCGMMNDELYVNYISRIFEASLVIETTINARPFNNNSSEIEIVSNYQFVSIETGTRWDFKTNEPKLILVGTPAYGAEPYRKCLSKNFLESSLKNKIRSLE